MTKRQTNYYKSNDFREFKRYWNDSKTTDLPTRITCLCLMFWGYNIKR